MKICKIQQPPIFTQKLQISIKSDFPNQFFLFFGGMWSGRSVFWRPYGPEYRAFFKSCLRFTDGVYLSTITSSFIGLLISPFFPHTQMYVHPNKYALRNSHVKTHSLIRNALAQICFHMSSGIQISHRLANQTIMMQVWMHAQMHANVRRNARTCAFTHECTFR